MKTFLLIILMSISFSTWSQTGRIIKGNIKTSDQLPAAFVNVQIKGTSKGATSDTKGNFTVRNVAEGSYTLIVSFIGLETREVQVVVGTDPVTTLPDIILKEDSQKLDEIVITGSKNYKENNLSQSLRLNAPLLEVPQNIQTVTSLMLSDQQVISMSDGLVRNVSGAVRLEHWGDLYTNITMRGSQLQAFRNGFNVVNSYWGPLTEDMSFVDHIEFVKGPAGFMLANGDPSGLYNVVTKKPTGKTKGEATFSLGSYDFYRTTLDLDGKLSKDRKLLYRLNIAAQNKGSFRPNEFNNRYTIAPVISYQLSDKTKVTLEYNLQLANMSNVGSYYIFSKNGYGSLPRDFTTMPAGLEPTKINDHTIFAGLQHSINANWTLNTQLSYLLYNQVGSSMWPGTVNEDGTLLRGVSIWDAQSRMTLGQVFLNGRLETGPIRHSILAGLDMGKKDYLADWGQTHLLDTVGAPFDPTNPSSAMPTNGFPNFDRTTSLEARAQLAGGLQDQRYSGVYLQDELAFFNNRIRLTLAGRYTSVTQAQYGGASTSAEHFTPRIGVSASINKYTSVYALYDQAFIPQGGRLRNGGEVKPITGNNTEIGIKKDWAGGRWNTTLSIYRIIKNNELTADPNSNPNEGLSVVLGEKTAEGIEFDLKGRIIKGLSLIANYAYTDSRVTKVTEGVTSISKGDVIPGFAKHTVNAWLNYRIEDGFLQGLGISGGLTYLSGRATASYSKTDKSINLPDYLKLDAGIFWERDQIKVNLNMFNIQDKFLYSGGYYDYLPAYYWQVESPRSLRLSVGYKF